MAKVFEETARQHGADVTRFDLYNVKGEGCRACMACRTAADRCVVQDGIGDVLKAFEAADVLVMAAPVWWVDFPVSLRRFVERWMGLVDAEFFPRMPEGKRAVLLISQGGKEDEFADLPTRYAGMLNWIGVKTCDFVRHCNADEQLLAESGVLERVKEVATKLD
jgi:multimeric flavodoxin WrbA